MTPETSFRRLDALKRHAFKEHKVTVYACDECEKPFSRKDELLSHLKSHTEKIYKCKHCDSCFLSNILLADHTRKCKSKPSLHCNECDETFTTKQKLAFHSKRHIPKPSLNCKWCNIKFSNQDSLNKHTKYHLFEMNNETPTTSFEMQESHNIDSVNPISDSHLQEFRFGGMKLMNERINICYVNATVNYHISDSL